jgi:hypothetical protein
MDKNATKGRNADIRVGHGPEGGAWIGASPGNGRGIERCRKRGGIFKNRSKGVSRGTRNRTWTHHQETAGHQHPQTAIIRIIYFTLQFVLLHGKIVIYLHHVKFKRQLAQFSNVSQDSFGDERVEEVLLPGQVHRPDCDCAIIMSASDLVLHGRPRVGGHIDRSIFCVFQILLLFNNYDNEI